MLSSKEIYGIKVEICRIGELLYRNGMVAANDGNITYRLGGNRFLATPTGVSKGAMDPDMITVIGADAKVESGLFEPSSECLMHLEVYKRRPDVRAVVHAHPPFGTTFAVAGKPLDKYILPESIYAIGSVPIAPYFRPGSREIALSIVPFLEMHNAILLENHGAITFGRDLNEAYFHMETLEHTAKITFLAGLIGGDKEIPKEDAIELIDRYKKNNPDGVHPGYRKYSQ